MRAVFLRHPHWVILTILLFVVAFTYVCWFISPLVVQMSTPVLMVVTFLILSRRMPDSILDWMFVLVILIPAAALICGLLRVAQPILPLLIAVIACLAVRNQLATKRKHGVSHSSDSNRGV